MQKIHRNISQRNRQKCCHGNKCCQVLLKNYNQLKSMQGFGMQRYPRKMFNPKKLVARCCRKTNQLQSVRGMENKEPIKIFVSQKKKKKSVAMATCCQVCQKTNPLQSVRGYGKQRTHKIFISQRNRQKCCHGNTCCQLSLKN